ncbi:MAG: DUF1698 domain-containing protein [bacterium]
MEAIQWYHEFDFGNGLKTTSFAPYRELWDMTKAFLDRIDFKGKSVLDIGCWDGYWSFYAERRGAKRVLATDMNSQRWAKWNIDLKPASSDPVPNEGFQLAHEVYDSKVEYRGDVNVYDLISLGSRFDIVLFLGVLYHLTHPMYAITQIRHVVAKEGIAVIESGVIADDKRSHMDFYYGANYGLEPYRRMDPSNWTLPTRRCLRDILKSNYFDVVAESALLHPDEALRERADTLSKSDRLIQAFVKRLCRRYDVPLRDEENVQRYGRMILQCAAVQRVDANYLYAPLMGLDVYDTRSAP